MSSLPRLSWWLITGEVLLLRALSAVGAWLMFSLLPISLVVIIVVASVSTFPFFRLRPDVGDHFVWVLVAWFALGTLCLLLIQWLGS